MDNYKLLNRLGRGAQGSVYLVEDKLTNNKCVLKKVECSDETEANKAFKEAVALQELKHPYICGYREFFVIWDKEEHAIFVCIVMDYYKLGDLERTLKQKRAKDEFLDELVFKKWIAQIIEALHFVHDKKVIHRDLKPSNIFLCDDLSVAIGDFGVATVMGSSRTKTRTAVGSLCWMAPEILDATPHYDERSDIWSLGCIALEMATCGIMDPAEISGVLFQLKESPQVLEDVLEGVSKHYSPDLCQLIRISLRRAFHQRPTARELVDLPYVQEGLGLINSALYRQQQGKGDGASEVKPVPTDGGVAALIRYMQDNGRSKASQIAALKQLKTLTNAQVGDDAKRAVLVAMTEWAGSVELQTLCCSVLGNIATTVSEGDLLFGYDFIQPVCIAMRSHAGSVELQTAASALIMSLSSDEVAAEILGRVGGVQDILAALRSFPSNQEIAFHCCTALWALSVVEGNMAIITKEKGVLDVCNALQSHATHRELVDAACSALWSLSMEDDNLSTMADVGVVELLLQAMTQHMQDPGVVKFACAALSSLSEVHEISAFYVLRTEGGMEGVPVVLKALGVHSGNSEVVESIATLFKEMASYGDIRKELVALKVADNISGLSNKFTANEGEERDANTAVENALAALAGNPPPK